MVDSDLIKNNIGTKELCLIDKDLSDVPDLSSLKNLEKIDFSKNQIKSLRNLPTLSNLKYLIIDDNNISSLVGVKPQPKLSFVSFLSTPLSDYSYLPIMCVIAFGDSIREVNGVTIDEKTLINGKKYRNKVKEYIQKGFIIIFENQKNIQLKHYSKGNIIGIDISSVGSSDFHVNGVGDLSHGFVSEHNVPRKAGFCSPNQSINATKLNNTDTSRILLSSSILESSPSCSEDETTFTTTLSIIDERQEPNFKTLLSPSKWYNSNTMEDLQCGITAPIAQENFKHHHLNYMINKVDQTNNYQEERIKTLTSDSDSDSGCELLLNKQKPDDSKIVKSNATNKACLNIANEVGFQKTSSMLRPPPPLETIKILSDVYNEDTEKFQNVFGQKYASNNNRRLSNTKNYSQHNNSLDDFIQSTLTEPSDDKLNFLQLHESSDDKSQYRDPQKDHLITGYNSIKNSTVSKNVQRKKKCVKKRNIKNSPDHGLIQPTVADTGKKKRPRKPKEAKKLTSFNKQISTANKRLSRPRVAYEGRAEVYETDDDLEDSDPSVFEKVNFFKLIGIDPDSDDEYLTGDEFDKNHEEEGIEGPEDLIAQLKAQARARFYQMRTVETSTLDEMEKFVAAYVRQALEKYQPTNQ